MIQLMKCLLAVLWQHAENGHLLYCSSSWTLWHWMHTPFAGNNYKRDFIIKLAVKLYSAEKKYKACRVPHVVHLKRVQDEAV